MRISLAIKPIANFKLNRVLIALLPAFWLHGGLGCDISHIPTNGHVDGKYVVRKGIDVKKLVIDLS